MKPYDYFTSAPWKNPRRESVIYMAVEPPAEWAAKRWVSLPHFNGPLDGVTRDVRISEFDGG